MVRRRQLRTQKAKVEEEKEARIRHAIEGLNSGKSIPTSFACGRGTWNQLFYIITAT